MKPTYRYRIDVMTLGRTELLYSTYCPARLLDDYVRDALAHKANLEDIVITVIPGGDPL